MLRARTLLAGLGASLAMAVSQTALADLYVAGGITSESAAAGRIELDTLISLERLHPQLDLRLATGLLLLEGDESDENAAWLLTPMLRYTFAGKREVYLEGGIGAAVFLDARIGSRDLSTAFQFQDRIALGGRVGPGELSLEFTHYSNAGIKDPNEGIEVLALGYRLPL
ncbi:acyloxyacyl hydrolase [Halomonas sp. LR3S48]|uniref:acyloxyacyl hydrolase n=1 Tax=Halomonadaceae TaxID=28256 RepID=UPI0021E39378|nr:acyloxyacyl hydrolase [Halomonas sp. LR3S48]UYG03696.1 acyloxyacyl hydrolase [Halomonas sp. LR3S48]